MQLELDWLKRWALYSPEAIALKDADTGRELSYARMDEISNRLAGYLRARFRIGEGDRVAILAQNELEYVALFFAVQRLRAILVPVNFRLASREISHILSDSGAKLLIHQKAYAELAISAAGPHTQLLGFDGEGGLCAAAEDPSLPASPISMEAIPFESPCMILYTSGTTGSPKGALITHEMIFWNAVSTSLRLNILQSDVALTFLPFFHTGGWNVLTTPFLHRGAKIILLKKFDADRVLELSERERTTLLFGVPTMMEMMRHSRRFATGDLSCVRYAIVGGEPMPIGLIRAWQERGIPVRQGYGLTEFGPNVFSLSEQDSLRKIGSIGFPNFYVDAKILSENGRECGPGEIGELCLRGPACTPGYWNNPEATAQAIRQGWLHTGDLVRRDDEGYYYVVGRMKDMFISGAENVYPAEVEQFLRTHPEVREVAVIGVPDEKWGEVGKAFVVTESGKPLDPGMLTDFCRSGLARYKTPRHFAFVPELPKGDSGKILKRALREMRA